MERNVRNKNYYTWWISLTTLPISTIAEDVFDFLQVIYTVSYMWVLGLWTYGAVFAIQMVNFISGEWIAEAKITIMNVCWKKW